MNISGDVIHSVLFVCMGNICRSPTAEAIFRNQVRNANATDMYAIDSAGTHAYHVGNLPDGRAIQAGKDRGYYLEDLRAREVSQRDFTKFSTIVAMDKHNLLFLEKIRPRHWQGDLKLMLDFHSQLPSGTEVPDPYYGGEDGFDRVIDMLEDACGGLLGYLQTVGD